MRTSLVRAIPGSTKAAILTADLGASNVIGRRTAASAWPDRPSHRPQRFIIADLGIPLDLARFFFGENARLPHAGRKSRTRTVSRLLIEQSYTAVAASA
ncbi:hypothetical protein [Benzoatithermus flavus]|uniref:Uncharacterized protein n=1 Tax=Benzoatithermus flavus TaxID=3108223 RepID=A0ABU8XXJ1_9PROT